MLNSILSVFFAPLWLWTCPIVIAVFLNELHWQRKTAISKLPYFMLKFQLSQPSLLHVRGGWIEQSSQLDVLSLFCKCCHLMVAEGHTLLFLRPGNCKLDFPEGATVYSCLYIPYPIVKCSFLRSFLLSC